MTTGTDTSSAVDPRVLERASRVRLVLLDSDGVLTDGRLYIGPNGFDARSFHVRDGMAVRMGQRGGLSFGIVSGRECDAVTDRAAELSIAEVHQGIHDKAACLDEILGRLQMAPEQVCFVGDDLVDIPAMRRVGFAAAPSDATPEALSAAHFVTNRKGGHGAVREVVDLVLRATGAWERVTARYER